MHALVADDEWMVDGCLLGGCEMDATLAHLKEGVPIEVEQAKREVLLRLLPELGVLFVAAQSESAALRLEIDG